MIEEVLYTAHHLIEEREKEGWVVVNKDMAHHGQYMVLMKREKESKDA